jgi:hypothetical protein
MTPSSRIGRKVAVLSIVSLGLGTATFGATSQAAAQTFLTGSAGKPAAQAPLASAPRMARPASHRPDHGWRRPHVTELGAPRHNHQLVASRHRRPVPAYLAPATASVLPNVTSVMEQQQTTFVQGQPQVVYLQPQCASPLIIRIERSGQEGDSRNRGRRGSASPQPLYGASHPCVPQVATVYQRDLQPGPRVLSVRN